MGLPFLLPDEASSGNDHPCPWYNACTVEHDFVIFRAGCVGNCFFPPDRPNEEGLLIHRDLESLVMALPAGFSLWATPNRRLVVIANQASKNVSDLVLPAPKTPATANVDRPDCRAETMDRAIERI